MKLGINNLTLQVTPSVVLDYHHKKGHGDRAGSGTLFRSS